MVKKIVEKLRDDGTVIYRIDRDRKAGEYVLNSDSSQAKYVEKVKLHGFEKLPAGMYAKGAGFTNAGSWLLSALSSEFGSKLRLTLSATLQSNIKKTSSTVQVTLNHNKLTAANNVVRNIKRERNDEIRSIVKAFLAANFPKQFEPANTLLLDYRPGKIAELLYTEDVLDNLNEADKNAIRTIFPSLIGEMAFSLKAAKKVKIVAEGLKKTQQVYLSKIIAEFEKKLKGKSSEETWQKFLRTHILTLLSTYAAVVEKQSVDLDGKYPDFMLIDAYGYLDVYEIKKPQTGVLSYDRSRKNYYWSPEVARAIAQTEKYLGSIQQYQLDLENKLRKQKIDAHIVRPRGFVIVGKRTDLKNEDMQHDFRVLNDGLKNLDLIFYDDLLTNIKALQERLVSSVPKK